MDLVILAAGMGSRFGGLKQIEPMDEYGNFIIDYSIYDAIEAGFDKVIFIIKEENFEIFKETIGNRIADKIKVEYVFQKLSLLPEGYSLPADRVKPLGTAQAILAAKDVVSDRFAIINADDFYGKESFVAAANFLKNSCKENVYGNVAYNVSNTMTENGSVKRGVLSCDSNDLLTHIEESSVEHVGDKIIATPLDENVKQFEISPNTPVSMNMFCFAGSIMDYLVKKFPTFLDNNKDNLAKCEYLIPTVVSELIAEKKVSVKVVKCDAVWYGVTYKEDKPFVVSSLKKLVEKGQYKPGLWK
jgi:NDP-sugar pyrophosphorylase family protein